MLVALLVFIELFNSVDSSFFDLYDFCLVFVVYWWLVVRYFVRFDFRLT